MKYLKIFSVSLVLLGACLHFANAQDFRRIKVVKDIAAKTSGFYEGYSEKTIENVFSYHSFRHDLGSSMITRCLDTPMPMAWKTELIEEIGESSTVGFVWVAAVNLADAGALFELYVNGVRRFEFPATRNKNWLVDGDDGSELGFTTVMIDQHFDGHGYMHLKIPAEWVKPGQKQEIRLEGQKAGMSTWIIVYEAKDAMDFLQRSSRFDSQIHLSVEKKQDQYDVNVQTLPVIADNITGYSIGKKRKKLKWVNNGGLAQSEFEIPLSKIDSELKIFDELGEIMVCNLNNITEERSAILPAGVLKNIKTSVSNNTFELRSVRSWMPSLVESILALSESPLAQSEVLLMNSSHQDIAWMDTPEKCIVERDTMLLTPLFERAEHDAEYRFDIEDALMIKEFIQRHPEKKGLVKELLRDGRISCGATYIQPYEEMYSGEALARQFYYGAKWLADEFDYEADTYWNVDVPGRTLQMPQLMAKSGVKNLVISRHDLGFFDWYSPDGSSVTSFSNGHYGDSYNALASEYYIALDYLSKYSFKWERFYSTDEQKKIIPVLSDWDMSPAKDYSTLISSWNGVSELVNSDGDKVPIKLPRFKEALAPEMFDLFRKANPDPIEIYGERPALWLYIHGPGHQKALKASREGDILLTQVEKIATINALSLESFLDYPEERLKEAWEQKIYPDHGWGGNGGKITDAYFWQKYEFARAEANDMMNLEMSKLASQIKLTDNTARPVMVFNSLNWLRTSAVVHELGFSPGTTRSVILKDANGQRIATQLSDVVNYKDGTIKHAKLNFIADDIPGLGYKTYYLSTDLTMIPQPMPKQRKRIENEFYVLEFANGGLKRIFDKELGSEIILPEGFNAGEVFTMRSIGNGAGEFDQVQQPDTVGFDQSGAYRTAWKLTEKGDVYTMYSYRQPIRNAVVEQNIILYQDIKQIDFKLELKNWEGVLYREFRMALPVNAENGKVVYEVPYGKLEVGKDEMDGAAGERYQVPAEDIHPRAMQNWINVSSDKIGVTLSSSVVGVDYIDMTGQASKSTLIQPILLASRRSCHGLGNEYLQTGDHEFCFSLNSHKPGWENGYRFGVEANEKLHVVSDFQTFADANLAEEISFFNLDADNIVISVIKKADDSDQVVMRAYELEGSETATKLESAFNFKAIARTNLIEQELEQAANKDLKMNLGRFAIETFLLK